MKNNVYKVSIFWASIKFCIAFALVAYFDFGIYIVIGYLLFSLEVTSNMQFLNVQEANKQFANIDNSKILDVTSMQEEIDELKELLSDYEIRLSEMQSLVE